MGRIVAVTCPTCGRLLPTAELFADHVEAHVERVRTFDERQALTDEDRKMLHAMKILAPEER